MKILKSREKHLTCIGGCLGVKAHVRFGSSFDFGAHVDYRIVLFLECNDCLKEDCDDEGVESQGEKEATLFQSSKDLRSIGMSAGEGGIFP